MAAIEKVRQERPADYLKMIASRSGTTSPAAVHLTPGEMKFQKPYYLVATFLRRVVGRGFRAMPRWEE